MMKEAEANADSDKKRRALVEARNHADAQIAAAQRTLDEAGDKASPADKAPFEAAINALKTAMASDSVSDIEAKSHALQVASTNFGAKAYQAGAAQGQQASGSSAGEDVVDADFEEIDDADGHKHG